MSMYPRFGIALGISGGNKNIIEACEMYQKAFNAIKTGEGTPSDSDDLHITIEINGFQILLGPGDKVEKVLESVICCEVHFDNENDLRKAYDVLIKDSMYNSIDGPFEWATLLGVVTDKFGVRWALYFNE